MKDFIQKIVVPACIYFSIITVPFALLVYAIYGGNGSDGTLSALRVSAFFAFALVFATANVLVKSDRIAFGLRVLSHALITGLGFLLFMLLPARLEGSGVLAGLFVYYVIYGVVLAVALIKRSQTKKLENRRSDYREMFKSKEKQD